MIEWFMVTAGLYCLAVFVGVHTIGMAIRLCLYQWACSEKEESAE